MKNGDLKLPELLSNWKKEVELSEKSLHEVPKLWEPVMIRLSPVDETSNPVSTMLLSQELEEEGS